MLGKSKTKPNTLGTQILKHSEVFHSYFKFRAVYIKVNTMSRFTNKVAPDGSERQNQSAKNIKTSAKSPKALERLEQLSLFYNLSIT